MPVDLIHKDTIKHFTPCSYGLNRYAHGKKNGWQRLIQLGSAITRPTDIAIQSALYPIFRAVNPFITVGINLANKEWGKAGWSFIFTPCKLAGACVAVTNFEGRQAFRLLWSLSGNWIVNGIKGEKQTNSFFWKRIFDIKFVEKMSKTRREELKWTGKKVYPLLPVFVPHCVSEEAKPLDQITLKAAYDNYKTYSPGRSYFSALRSIWPELIYNNFKNINKGIQQGQSQAQGMV